MTLDMDFCIAPRAFQESIPRVSGRNPGDDRLDEVEARGKAPVVELCLAPTIITTSEPVERPAPNAHEDARRAPGAWPITQPDEQRRH
jgi:hypothetical protein